MIEEEITALKFSNKVITNRIGDMTLIESMVEVCNEFDVPYEDVCKFNNEREVVRGSLNGKSTKLTIKENINLITPSLYDKLKAESESLGLLKNRSKVNNDC